MAQSNGLTNVTPPHQFREAPALRDEFAGARPASIASLISQSSDQDRKAAPKGSTASADQADRAVNALIRRVLCHARAGADKARSIDQVLPPLTSNNEVDVQLYGIVAVIVKDLVHSWYAKFSPDDQFVEEVVQTIAHCTRELESRLRKLDLQDLLLDELPAILTQHIQAYRISSSAKEIGQYVKHDPRAIYHQLRPHPALEPAPSPGYSKDNDIRLQHDLAYRQLLAQSMLAVLLPTEDLENASLRTLVGDVIAESILGNTINGKLCKNWFIWAQIGRSADLLKRQSVPEGLQKRASSDAESRLERFGLLSNAIDSNALAVQKQQSLTISVLWRFLQYGFMVLYLTRALIICLFTLTAQALAPSRYQNRPSIPTAHSGHDAEGPQLKALWTSRQKAPILGRAIWSMLSSVIDLPSRMPWFHGSMSLWQYHLTRGWLCKLGGTGGLFDQYIHTLLTTHLDPATLLPTLLALTRQNLFPANNIQQSDPIPDPSPAESEALKRDTAIKILDLLPAMITRHYFASDTDTDTDGDENENATAIAGVMDELDIFGDEYMNKHFIYRILDLVLVRVLPELGQKSVTELLEERIHA